MDASSLLNLIIGALTGLVGGLAWLFKLQGDVRVLRERLSGEIELRKAIENRVSGVETEIREKLDYIIEQLGRKADR